MGGEIESALNMQFFFIRDNRLVHDFSKLDNISIP